MNQILDYSPNKSTGGKSSKSDKIVRIFAILLAVFAVCLFGVAGYSIINNKGDEETVNSGSQETKPVISVEEDGSVLKIKVVHDKALDKIVYNWDSEEEFTIPCNNQTEFSTEIALVAGNHYLTILAIDVNGVESTHGETFESDVGEDKQKPVIEGGEKKDIEGNKVKFTITDETELAFVTYRWNGEEEKNIEASEDDPKTIKLEIEIPKGENDLVVIAVDKSNNSTSFQKSYTGTTLPDITFTVSAEKDLVAVRVFHESGLKEILLEINGQSQKVSLPENTKDGVAFNFQISGARNVVKVVATSLDGTTTSAEEEIINDNLINDNIKITLVQSETDAHKGNVNISSPDGMKELNLVVNDVDIPVDLSAYNPEDVKVIDFEVPLVDGANTITFKVTKPDGTTKEETQELYC